LIGKAQMVIKKNVKIHDYSIINAYSQQGVVLHENVVLGEFCRIKCSGRMTKLGLGCEIGKNSSFGAFCYFGAVGGIRVGEDVIAGENIRFHAENHNYSDPHQLIKDQGVSHKGIRIGNNCWIGSGVVFLDGSEIGNGCVVGANAVITKKFADNVVIVGNPGKILKKRCE